MVPATGYGGWRRGDSLRAMTELLAAAAAAAAASIIHGNLRVEVALHQYSTTDGRCVSRIVQFRSRRSRTNVNFASLRAEDIFCVFRGDE